MADREHSLPTRLPLWAHIMDDSIAIGFKPLGDPVAYFNGDNEGIDTANRIVRLWNANLETST